MLWRCSKPEYHATLQVRLRQVIDWAPTQNDASKMGGCVLLLVQVQLAADEHICGWVTYQPATRLPLARRIRNLSNIVLALNKMNAWHDLSGYRLNKHQYGTGVRLFELYRRCRERQKHASVQEADGTFLRYPICAGQGIKAHKMFICKVRLS